MLLEDISMSGSENYYVLIATYIESLISNKFLHLPYPSPPKWKTPEMSTSISKNTSLGDRTSQVKNSEVKERKQA